jgi:hypothetical protein
MAKPVVRDGGLFGLGSAISRETDLALPARVLSEPPIDPEMPRRQALAKALRKWRPLRRRGAPVKGWRKELRAPILKVMERHPELSDAEIARVLLDDLGEESLRRKAGIANINTIQNWLSEIRQGRTGYGRKPKPMSR